MKEKVIGFLILRKPESMDTVKPGKRLFKIGDKFYHGIDRSHLNDCIEDYFKKILPNEISDIIKRDFEESHTIFFPHRYIRDFGDAKKLFNYVNKNNLNELIVISSDRIIEVKGFSKIDSSLIEWLGYDSYILGGYSLIENGVYFKPHLFEKWIDRLNTFGLFDSLDDCSGYFDDFLEVSKSGQVEDYALTEENSEPIRVGRIII